MSRSSSRIAGASMKNRMTGCGPSRSGWTTKVVVAPSRVAMSTWFSIMEVSRPKRQGRRTQDLARETRVNSRLRAKIFIASVVGSRLACQTPRSP